MMASFRAMALFFGLVLSSACAADFFSLERDFASPPDDTKPRIYWYWMDGHYNKAGITKDLEAMQRIGIGEAYIGLINGQTGQTPGEVKVMTEPFWDIMTHAIKEGTRLGVDIGVFNSPGWSQSGGPWVKSEQAMRYLVMPEIRLRGPQQFSDKLVQPVGGFQDVAVLAFPAPKGDADSVTSLGGQVTREPDKVTIDFPAPLIVRSLIVTPSAAVNATAELEASQDGSAFQSIRKFMIDRHDIRPEVGPVPLAPIVISLPAITARSFRLVLSAPAEIGDVQLSSASRIEDIAEKSLAKAFQYPLPPFDFYSWPPQAEPDSPDRVVSLESVKNLTSKLRPDGTFDWQVPEGDWVIQRIGMIPTGTMNTPAPGEVTGLEVDKMNRVALKSHFDTYIGELLSRLSLADRKSWKHVVADSYEKGPQNWTDGFDEPFQQRYGYDPIPFLPVLSGRMVGGSEKSNRFLWDLRRLVADRVAFDYVGGLRELCQEHGLRVWLENYGHWGFPSEFLLYGGQSDEIGGEFWESGSIGSVELRAASSAAHIYGKRQVFAEAWTGGEMYLSTPWSMKKRGDWALCQGINQFVLHVYIQQPWDDRKPGVDAAFGTEFNRNNTWFDLSRSWIDYQRRCSVLLQSGLHVADIAYFIGEDTPKMTGLLQPALPPGHDFDFINADVLLHRARVEQGRLVLADGTNYRLLVLPPSESMRPETLARIKSFVDAGLPVLGALPSHSPSLQGYPECDAIVQKLASELVGRVLSGDDIAAALGVPPDLGDVDHTQILYTHRQDGDIDIYFLSNQTDAPTLLHPSFRVAGKVAELWHPDTGEIEQLPSESLNGLTQASIPLDARGSVFVVFRPATASTHSISSVTRSGRPVIPTLPKPRPTKIIKAAYGIPGDATRTRDVRARLQSLVDDGVYDVQVGKMAEGDDPALYSVKTLEVEYSVDGRQSKRAIGVDPETIHLNAASEYFSRGAVVRRNPSGQLSLTVTQPGNYEVKTANGQKMQATVSTVPDPITLDGPWKVSFPPDSGAPESVIFDRLVSFTESAIPGVKFFSGTATYTKTFEWKPSIQNGKRIPEIWLNLGDIKEVARVTLNGVDLGAVWRPPFEVNMTRALRPGSNDLEIRVANLWRNRMIGDASLPKEQRVTWSSNAKFTADTPLPDAGMLGPVTIKTTETVPLLLTQ